MDSCASLQAVRAIVGGNIAVDVKLIEDRRLWNTFISETSTGHICQIYEWSEHSEDVAARQKAMHVGVMDNDRLVGAMLLVCSQVRGVPRPLYYAPRGPVVAEPDSPILKTLMDGAADLVRKAGGFAIRIEPNIVEGDLRWINAFKKLGYKQTHHTVQWRNVWVLDIRPSEHDLLYNNGMKETWRYNIGLAQRKKIIIREGHGDADLDMFYEMYTETAKRQGFYLYAKSVLREMLACYTPETAARDNTAEMVMFIAEYEQEPLAVITVACHGHWAWYMHSATGMKHRNLKPNYLLQWTAFKWAKERGVWFYDFRGIPEILEPGQEMYGVYDFKRGFGGHARCVIPTMDKIINPLFYYPYTMGVDLNKRLQERKAKQSEASNSPTNTTPDSEKKGEQKEQISKVE
jgi:peptidoglycan pentaglycine glycine transferase (the first glycine)